MTDKHVYMIVLRISVFLGGIALWWISVNFSVAGFSFTLEGMLWAGWTLAIVITLLQLVFNKGVYYNPTLFYGGLLAYVYGFLTNQIGIMRAMEIVDKVFSEFTSDPGYYGVRTFLATIIALGIEIAPEAMVLWAIFLDKPDVGDFVSTISKGTILSKKKVNNVRKSVQKRVQKRVHGQDRTKTGQNRTNQGQRTEFVPDRTEPGQSQDKDIKVVLSYCNAHKRKHGSLPAVRKVEHDTGVPKTKVADIMKPLRSRWE